MYFFLYTCYVWNKMVEILNYIFFVYLRSESFSIFPSLYILVMCAIDSPTSIQVFRSCPKKVHHTITISGSFFLSTLLFHSGFNIGFKKKLSGGDRFFFSYFLPTKKIYKKRERKKVKEVVCVYIHAHIPTQIPMEWSGCSQFHLLRNLFLLLSLKRPVLLRKERKRKRKREFGSCSWCWCEKKLQERSCYYFDMIWLFATQWLICVADNSGVWLVSNLFRVIKLRKEEKTKTGKEGKMKSMNDGNTDDGNNHNWLGFSLSPHMKMEITSSADPPHHHHHHYYHHPQVSAAAGPCNTVPTGFYISPSHLNPSGICYGVGENSAFHPPLAMMPLKSDGSLCIMEALTRSQTQGIYPSSPLPCIQNFPFFRSKILVLIHSRW